MLAVNAQNQALCRVILAPMCEKLDCRLVLGSRRSLLSGVAALLIRRITRRVVREDVARVLLSPEFKPACPGKHAVGRALVHSTLAGIMSRARRNSEEAIHAPGCLMLRRTRSLRSKPLDRRRGAASRHCESVRLESADCLLSASVESRVGKTGGLSRLFFCA